MKKRSAVKWVGLTLAGLGAFVSSNAFAAHTMHAESKGGLKVFTSENEDFWFGIGGRLNLDQVIFSGNTKDKGNDFPSGANIRRAFLKFNGGVGEFLTYNLTLDFDNSSTTFQDAWLNYAGLADNFNLRVGQFTPPTTIDDWSNFGTNNSGLFLESSLATMAFSKPAKVLGLWADVTLADQFMLNAAVYQPRQATGVNSDASMTNYGNTSRSDRVGGSVRLTFSPVHTDDTVYHLGAVGRYQSMSNLNANGTPVFQPNLFSTTPEVRARNTSQFLLDTGAIRARSYNVVAGEALAIWGPVTLEGEYYHTNVQRVPSNNDVNTLGNPRFRGWHVQGGYMLTGESRVYSFSEGTLRNPIPASKEGAWEVVARYSMVNLNKGQKVYGGKGNSATLGLNWFVNENVHLAFNYNRVTIHPTSAAPVGTATADIGTTHKVGPGVKPATDVKRQLDIFGLRFGVAF